MILFLMKREGRSITQKSDVLGSDRFRHRSLTKASKVNFIKFQVGWNYQQLKI
jgi:hypothetical protein